MADPSITNVISEPLVQYGVLGAFMLYALYTDFTTRREARLMEAARIKREEKREEDCIVRVRQLENRHKQQLLGVIVRNNQLIEILLHEKGIDIPTPQPQPTERE